MPSSRDQVIRRSLRLCGVIQPGDSPTAEEMADAAESLNMMLTSWVADGLHLWLQGEGTLTPLVVGQAGYVLSPGGVTPKRIPAARLNLASGTEIPIFVGAREDYMRLPTKTTQGKPNQCFYDPHIGTLYLWPTPDVTTDSITYTYERPFDSVAFGSDTLDIPDEWMDAVCFNLAVNLAMEYDVPMDKAQALKAMADEKKALLLTYDREEASMFLQPSPNG